MKSFYEAPEIPDIPNPEGCCVTPDAGEPLYLYFDGNTSGVNKAYCESADIGGIFQVISGDNPCNDLSLQGICYP